METNDIICGIQDRVHADGILLIDALAARSTQRVNTTIQLTDTGVSPGAGIGNRRQPLSPQTLGVPGIA
ncbi:MAG: GPR endopeptidase, partial [Firmicutes bacterium]|nr:GPR endopeptidase [Bacillota bacterium]